MFLPQFLIVSSASKYKQAKQDFLDFNEAMGVDGIIGHLGPKLEEIRTRREDIVDRRASKILFSSVFIILNQISKERKLRSWKRLRKQEV